MTKKEQTERILKANSLGFGIENLESSPRYVSLLLRQILSIPFADRQRHQVWDSYRAGNPHLEAVSFRSRTVSVAIFLSSHAKARSAMSLRMTCWMTSRIISSISHSGISERVARFVLLLCHGSSLPTLTLVSRCLCDHTASRLAGGGELTAGE
jgi:hypothetical protein